MNKSARICLKIFGDTIIESWSMEKTRKSSHVPVLRQEKLADLFLPNFKHDQKLFIRIFSLNIPEMRLLDTFKSILSSGYNETMTVIKFRLRNNLDPWP